MVYIYTMKILVLYVMLLVMAGGACTQTTDGWPLITSPLSLVATLPGTLKESSALVVTPHGLFSLSDNSRPEFFRLDTASGEILQTIGIRNIDFVDKEALAFDGTYFYIGDFGNNLSLRKDLKIVKVDARQIGNQQEVLVDGQVITFHYPEQEMRSVLSKDNSFDCEAMVVAGDSLYLFTKQRSDHQTTLYALPKEPGTYAAIRKAEFDVRGRVTDAALSPDQKTLLLLGYQEKHQYPFLWKFTNFRGQDFFAGTAQHQELIREPLNWQTEGIAFIDSRQIFVSCETTREVPAALFKASLDKIIP